MNYPIILFIYLLKIEIDEFHYVTDDIECSFCGGQL